MNTLLSISAALVVLALPAAAPLAQAAEVDSVVFLHEVQGQGFHMIVQTNSANVGDTVRFTIMNQGYDHDNTAHDFVFCGDGATPNPPCQDKWGFSGLIQNNQTAIVTVPAKKAGDFAVYCDLAGHAAAGMAEVFHVQGAATTGGKSSGGGAIIGTLIALLAVAGIRRKVKP